MRPVIIGIGGACSGVGKTSVICEILQSLEGWGAIKYTKTPFYSSVTDDVIILSREGKDTRRFLDSGAAKVVWIQSPYPELPESLSMAIGMLSQVKGILVEGNSAVEAINPDIVMFISGGSRKNRKESAQRIMEKADIVLYEKEASQTTHKARQFHINQKDKYMQCLKELLDRIRA
jgi:molybdopterin-guanine dinucleotide biosynthesis protein